MMSDLPERIWAFEDRSWSHRKPVVNWVFAEYLRADLAPTVGFSREQMRGAMELYATTDHTMDEILSTLTPAAPDPKVLEQALEEIAMGPDIMGYAIAREALAEYRKGVRG
jgi:hypothetical protein